MSVINGVDKRKGTPERKAGLRQYLKFKIEMVDVVSDCQHGKVNVNAKAGC